MTHHTKDSDCTLNVETGCCLECGAYHGDVPCESCGGYAFHNDGCTELDYLADDDGEGIES